MLKLESKPVSVILVSASPGIIAMVLGVLLMIAVIASKDSFPNYPSQSNPSQSAPADGNALNQKG